MSCQGWFIPHPCLCFLTLRWHAFTLIPYNPSQVIEMLTIFANLVTKFECVVFGSYLHILCCTLLHAWGYSTPLVSLSSCSCSKSNLLPKHGVEHDSLLHFIPYVMFLF